MTEFYIFLGGGLGALSRWLVSTLCNTDFPWGTLLVNVVGSFFMGLIVGFFHNQVPQPWSSAITTGFLGGFTTFSSFSLEQVDRLYQQHYLAAGYHAMAHVFCSVFACYLGYIAGLKLNHHR